MTIKNCQNLTQRHFLNFIKAVSLVNFSFVFIKFCFGSQHQRLHQNLHLFEILANGGNFKLRL